MRLKVVIRVLGYDAQSAPLVLLAGDGKRLKLVLQLLVSVGLRRGGASL